MLGIGTHDLDLPAHPTASRTMGVHQYRETGATGLLPMVSQPAKQNQSLVHVIRIREARSNECLVEPEKHLWGIKSRHAWRETRSHE